ncbi:MAG: RpiB/LacA/LacB family sugar-phosphate isomerase, partial [bacterium]|nr:RpiB/LacA/LacB family sugar-phosphate isomerase [bacterium]
YPDYAKKLAESILQNPNSCGIGICRSGDGMSIAANRYKGIRCSLGISEAQVIHTKEDNNINILALGADFTDFDLSVKLVKAFLNTQPNTEEKYLRRINKLDSD